MRRTLLMIIVLLISSMTVAAQSSPCGDTETVVAGDTLADIAQRCRVTVEDILALNPDISRESPLVVGEVLQLPTESETGQTPLVAIYPLSGAPGASVTVIANGFPADTQVNIGIGVPASEYNVVQRVTTTANGALSTTVEMPDTTGEYVVVVETPDYTTDAISYPFTVIAQDGDTGAPLFDSTDIYLIALEDGGDVGCGDSVVPYTITFDEPTAAPLTNALAAMLNSDTRLYEDSGLYNALYQSDLRIERITIENGFATIRLAGTLQLGGVCDVPRLQAQLRQTALQYVTIDDVQFYINGTPLEDIE